MASESDLARILSSLTAGFIALAAVACSKDEPAPPRAQDQSNRKVFAVNYPLAYFAERLAPKGIEVVFLAPPGTDPAFWKPSVEEISRYQTAGVILLNGAGYAKWTKVASLPTHRLVVTADGCVDAFLPTGESHTHRHGPEGAHAHERTAFTTWLDLRLAQCQAERVRDAVVRLAPAAAQSVEQRFEGLAADLNRLDERLRGAGKALGGRPILASHPVYQYLAEAYGLNLESLHFEPDQPLDSAAMDALDAVLRRHRARLMLWEAEPRSETARTLRERGVDAVIFAPAGARPASGDFLTVMRANAERLACAAGTEACP